MKMAPNHGYVLTDVSGEPVSRTYQYRKVMKPMLERKRRARINRCLDELKELMTGALQTEGENVAKLEKADILELTVRHLHNLRRQNQMGGVRPEQSYADKFRAGFRHCAAEVTNFLGQVDQHTSVHVLKHLNSCIKRLEVLPNAAAAPPPPVPQPRLMGPPPSLSPSPPPPAPPPPPPHVYQLQQKQQRHPPGRPQPQGHLPPPLPPPPPQLAANDRHIMIPAHQNFQRPYNRPVGDVDHEMINYGHDITQINTPPNSPNIDVDDMPVWRPW